MSGAAVWAAPRARGKVTAMTATILEHLADVRLVKFLTPRRRLAAARLRT
jgi:hypothetical protein